MTPAAALLDRLLELDQPGRISVGLAVLALAISKLPAAERRARDGWIWTCR